MGRGSLSSLAATGALGLGLLVASGTGTTHAQWQDQASLTGQTLEAGTMAPPVLECRDDGGLLELGLLFEGAYLFWSVDGGEEPLSFVIFRDGTPVERVPGTRRAWDADKSGQYTVMSSLAPHDAQLDAPFWTSQSSNGVGVFVLDVAFLDVTESCES
jgi:hypothetical protein